ncbi:MAG: DUF3311 domain-containing protein [Gemmatimonadetes bacterium]|nr:DUF3311 domain-containing protein [Gemmatimonadota bacterium]
MSVRAARAFAAAYLIAMAVAVTWPGVIPFNRVEPRVLGLPFVMAWIAAWVAGAVPVLWLLDRAETRRRRDRGSR